MPSRGPLLRQLERHTLRSLWQQSRRNRRIARQLGDREIHRQEELQQAREDLEVVTKSPPYRLLKTLGYAYKRRRYLVPAASRLLKPFAWMVDTLCRLTGKPMGLWLDRLPFTDPSLYWVYKPEVMRAIGNRLLDDAGALARLSSPSSPSAWFRRYRPARALLRQFRSRSRPFAAPRFTVLVMLDGASDPGLAETLRSIAGQTYGAWEVIAVCPTVASAEQRAIIDTFADSDPQANRWALLEDTEESLDGEPIDKARGDFLCLVRQGDLFEPQALDRLVDAICRDDADLLYSDEVIIGEDLDTILDVKTRPAFSLYHYLSHAYFQPLAVRTTRVRDAGGLGESLGLASTDLILRLLEHPLVVTHVADILCRRRRPSASCQANAAVEHRAAVECWLSRQSVEAEVRSTDHPDCLNVVFPTSGRERVAVIVPTKNGFEHLRRCLVGLQATVPADLLDLVIVDHESDDPRVLELLEQVDRDHRVLRYQGPFNYSEINNFAVSRLEERYSYYLFLNNDVEPLGPGWLEHMLGYGTRPDVAVVGALLIYPDRRVQHAGVWAGMSWGACHPYRYTEVYEGDGRAPGLDMALLATRELSAVTGACMLVEASTFHLAGRFDPALAVGFGDVDLCLRIGALGKKVIFDSHAVLVHHESVTRGKSNTDPHPADTQRFRLRYLDQILSGDRFVSPFRSRYAPDMLNPSARCAEQTLARTVSFIPPTREPDTAIPKPRPAAA